MIETEQVKEVIKPIINDSTDMILAWKSPISNTTQIVLFGSPQDTLLLVARTMYRMDEQLDFSLDAQIEALEAVFHEMKKAGAKSITMEEGEIRYNGRFN